jgi:hypothetical protein
MVSLEVLKAEAEERARKVAEKVAERKRKAAERAAKWAQKVVRKPASPAEKAERRAKRIAREAAEWEARTQRALQPPADPHSKYDRHVADWLVQRLAHETAWDRELARAQWRVAALTKRRDELAAGDPDTRIPSPTGIERRPRREWVARADRILQGAIAELAKLERMTEEDRQALDGAQAGAEEFERREALKRWR